MQIEDDISHVFLFVEGELKRHEEGLYSKPLSDSTRRLEYFRIVDEPRRANEHVGQLFHDSVGRVVLHFEEGGLHGDFGVVGLLLGYAGFLEGHIH